MTTNILKAAVFTMLPVPVELLVQPYRNDAENWLSWLTLSSIALTVFVGICLKLEEDEMQRLALEGGDLHQGILEVSEGGDKTPLGPQISYILLTAADVLCLCGSVLLLLCPGFGTTREDGEDGEDGTKVICIGATSHKTTVQSNLSTDGSAVGEQRLGDGEVGDTRQSEDKEAELSAVPREELDHGKELPTIRSYRNGIAGTQRLPRSTSNVSDNGEYLELVPSQPWSNAATHVNSWQLEDERQGLPPHTDEFIHGQPKCWHENEIKHGDEVGIEALTDALSQFPTHESSPR